MNKQQINQAFTGYSDSYCITTIIRGKKYLIKYYHGFHSSNIIHSILQRNIHDWDPITQTFIVSD